MTARGPKRQQPLSPKTMATVTARLPASLIMRLDEETQRLAKATGVSTINRSDLMRTLLERALKTA